MRSLPAEVYQVGVICPLPHDMTAVKATLDEVHEPPPESKAQDENSYAVGQIHGHNVVITCLPFGTCGTNKAATVAKDLLRTFPNVRIGLMVGTGGGIPNLEKRQDIRLGDVVISKPDQGYGGVVQYDFGKDLGEDHFDHRDVLGNPPSRHLSALSNLESDHQLYRTQIPVYLNEMMTKHPHLTSQGYGYPTEEEDFLYCPKYHDTSSYHSCDLCVVGKILRATRPDRNPRFWYGTIASGNLLIRNANTRDTLGKKFGALCVEMEAAGLSDFPCIVVRGICDYADSHANYSWQKYAASTAAAYAKEFLRYVKPVECSWQNAAEKQLLSRVAFRNPDGKTVQLLLHVAAPFDADTKDQDIDGEIVLYPQREFMRWAKKTALNGWLRANSE